MDGVFWHNDIGFVVDPQHMASSFPDGQSIGPLDFHNELLKSGALPALGPAPVASWLLARLFHLSRERLGFETTEQVLNDGGGYYLNIIVFTHDLVPLAFLKLHGNDAHVRVWGECSSQTSPDQAIGTFADALVAEPLGLMECRIITRDTDPPDLDKRRIGKPHVLGWDGSKFLGYRRQEER